MQKLVFAGAVAVASLLVAAPAIAQNATAPTDCPPGSVGKAEGQNSWCEPTVCETEGQCTPGQACQSIGLCVQVGTLAKDGGAALTDDKRAGNRLIAVGRCAANSACPENTVCNTKKRCMSRAEADKLSPPTNESHTTEPKKSSCGCDTVGRRSGGLIGFTSVLAIVGLAGAAAARRRRRPLV